MKNWYVIFSKSRKEMFVKKQLAARDIETYLPMIQTGVKDNRPHKPKPFFPRYLFVRADLDQIGISAFQWLPGAVGLVQFGGEPSVLSDREINDIKYHVNEINALGEKSLKRMKTGDRVMIQDGPFKGYEAIFDAYITGSERVRIFLKYLKDRLVRMEISSRLIRYPKRL